MFCVFLVCVTCVHTFPIALIFDCIPSCLRVGSLSGKRVKRSAYGVLDQQTSETGDDGDDHDDDGQYHEDGLYDEYNNSLGALGGGGGGGAGRRTASSSRAPVVVVGDGGLGSLEHQERMRTRRQAAYPSPFACGGLCCSCVGACLGMLASGASALGGVVAGTVAGKAASGGGSSGSHQGGGRASGGSGESGYATAVGRDADEGNEF